MRRFCAALTYSVRSLAHARNAVAIDWTTVEYGESDVLVAEHTDHEGKAFWTKTLPLAAGFTLAAVVADEPSDSENGGLGLFLRRRDDPGFSWEWFVPSTDDVNVFDKLQGDGQLHVSYFDNRGAGRAGLGRKWRRRWRG